MGAIKRETLLTAG